MQQSPIRWRETKGLFFVRSRLWSSYSLRRRGPSAVRGGAFGWDPRGPLCGDGRAAGALRCRELLRPADLYRLLWAPGWVRPAFGRGPRDSGPAGPKVRPQVASAHREAARQPARGGLLCIMCGSALAFLTAALLCLHNCQRGPVLVLRAAWLFSLVIGLDQSGKLFCFVFFPSSNVLGWHWELLAWTSLTGKWWMLVLLSPES